jgi:hypothetical protein
LGKNAAITLKFREGQQFRPCKVFKIAWLREEIPS